MIAPFGLQQKDGVFSLAEGWIFRQRISRTFEAPPALQGIAASPHLLESRPSTCLTGRSIGPFSFSFPHAIGCDKLVDTAHGV